MAFIKRWTVLLAAAAMTAVGVVALMAAGEDARYSNRLQWTANRITKTLALGYTELGSSSSRGNAEVKAIGDRSCLVGTSVAFDVDDAYAFDIDEAVDVVLTYVPELTTAEALVMLFDRNGQDGRGSTEVVPERAGQTARATLRLEHARLAGQGAQGTDLAVTARQGTWRFDIGSSAGEPAAAFVPCGRSKTRRPAARRRVGYDGLAAALPWTGRSCPAGDPAAWMNQAPSWPVKAGILLRQRKHAVPAGTYHWSSLRRVSCAGRATVQPDNAAVPSRSPRYDDLPKRAGSGESHVHLGRDQVADPEVWAQVAAEDLHIAHLLEMGNIMGTYFKQPAWGRRGRYERDGVALVSGQEDPRTVMRGHTIHWNVDTHAHFEAEVFFQYHLVFERTRLGGATTGYAHLGELFNGRRGLALDVPFGLVEFIEVLQGGRLSTQV